MWKYFFLDQRVENIFRANIVTQNTLKLNHDKSLQIYFFLCKMLWKKKKKKKDFLKAAESGTVEILNKNASKSLVSIFFFFFFFKFR